VSTSACRPQPPCFETFDGIGGTAIRAVCFHGRRERDGGGDFLLAARLLGRAAEKAGVFAQVRTPGFPKLAGAPDRAVARLSLTPFQNLDVPSSFHLEVVADPRLAVIPPMGDALLPGGWLLVNALSPPRSPRSGPAVRFADLSALAARLGGPLGVALAAGAWAILGEMEPRMHSDLDYLEHALAEEGVDALPLARASFETVRHARPAGGPVTRTGS